MIPPGDYRLDGIEPIPLRSHTHVVARGARFHFPDDLGERTRREMFTGRNLRDVSWTGGHFAGRVFDPARGAANPWPPHANTRPIVVTTTADGETANLAFRGGGRGSWINQPKNLVIADNVFVNNTTKCEPDPRCGRRAFAADGFERDAEMYFTTHEPGGRYGNVIIRGNVFTSGSHATHAITFAPGGDTILVCDNVFVGPVRDIPAPEGCTNVTIRDNLESLPPEK